MPPIMSSRGHLRARKIWIDDALGGTARCRLGALRQRGIAAFDEALFVAVELQADRIVRAIRLGPSRCRRQNRRDRQNRQSRNAHQSLLRAVRAQNVFRVASASRQAALFPVNSRSRVGAARVMQSFGAPPVHMIKLTETRDRIATSHDEGGSRGIITSPFPLGRSPKLLVSQTQCYQTVFGSKSTVSH
jgi:hypothetical protein